jgi:hypothetical protein
MLNLADVSWRCRSPFTLTKKSHGEIAERRVRFLRPPPQDPERRLGPMRYTTHRTPLTCSMTARSVVISATASLMARLGGLVGLRYVDIQTLRADDSAGVVSQSVR